MTDTTTAPAKKRARFNALNVSEIRKLTDEAIEVAFAIPEELARRLQLRTRSVRGIACRYRR